MLSSDKKPFVSVIVPVYNGAGRIEPMIESLLSQDYPRELFEIIIADNGSTDDTREIAGGYPVQVEVERDIRTSYAARNRGIAVARGEILAFIDVDCLARAEWISAGVSALADGGADIAGGRAEFVFSQNPTPAEYLDSIINLHNESSIKNSRGARTFNLFVRRAAFDKWGMFRVEQASGEDMGWTSRAVKAGAKIVYAVDAVVSHEARRFRALLKKHFRVGTGSLSVWRSSGRSEFWILCRFLSLFLPFLSFRLPALIRRRGSLYIRYPVIPMMGIAYLCTIATGCGVIKSLWK